MQETTSSLTATSIAHFINDGSMYAFITLYPKLFPNSALLIGILASLFSTFSVAASPFIGRRADAGRSYAKLLSLGIVLLGVGLFGYSLSPSSLSSLNLFYFLIPFTVAAGIGSSFYHPVGATILRDKWGLQSSGRAMGINGSIGSFGRAIYPLIVIALVESFTLPSVVILGIGAIAAAAGILFILRGMAFPSKVAVSQENSKSSIPLRSFIRSIFALTVVSFTRGLFAFGIITFVPYYLIHVEGFSYSFQLAIAFSLMLVTPIFGQPAWGYLADRFGRRLTLMITIVGSLVSILLFVSSKSPTLDVVYLALFGLFTLTLFPILLPLATSIVPEGASTMSGSIVWGIGNVGGGAVGPIVVGILAEQAVLGSLNSAFLVLVVIGALSLVLLPLVPKPRRN